MTVGRHAKTAGGCNDGGEAYNDGVETRNDGWEKFELMILKHFGIFVCKYIFAIITTY